MEDDSFIVVNPNYHVNLKKTSTKRVLVKNKIKLSTERQESIIIYKSHPKLKSTIVD